MEAVVEVRNLQYAYPDGTIALHGVDFTLHEGETVALLGGNGSGKTTFILCLAGLLSGAQGKIIVGGTELTASTGSQIRSQLGLVFQDADDQLFLSPVLHDVMFGPLNQGLSRAEAESAARTALEQTGLRSGYERPPYHLSAGEKRRVAMAGVLAMNPKVLVLDEPTTYLDPPGQRDLLNVLRTLCQPKILVTHDVAFAAALATRAVFFEKGRVAGSGTVAEVVEQFTWSLH